MSKPRRAKRSGWRTFFIALMVVVALALGLVIWPNSRAVLLGAPASSASTSTTPAGPKLPGWVPRPAQPAARAPAPVLASLGTPSKPSAALVAQRVGRISTKKVGKTSLVVIDSQTGQSLVNRNDRPSIPASTMKVMTSFGVLASMDAQQRFTTSVVEGKSGHIVLVGGGDPYLAIKRDRSNPQLASLEQLARLTAARLKTDRRTKVVLGYDATLFSGPSWHSSWVKQYRYAVTPVTALMADKAKKPDWSREKNPPAVAAKKFADYLRRNGIKVTRVAAERAVKPSTTLAAMHSLTVAQIVERVLVNSDNDAAEVLLRHIGVANKTGGSFRGGTKALQAVLAKYRIWRSGLRLMDGSGLSRDNRLRPTALVTALRVALTDSRFAPLISGLPAAGISGTLLDRFDESKEYPARGRVRAKTGSLRQVSTLAGYVTAKDGSLLVFSAVVNDMVAHKAAWDWIDRTAATLASCGCRA